MNRRRANAFLRGLADGLDQPFDLSMGVSYPDPDRQDAWDRGCNIGQATGQLAAASRQFLNILRNSGGEPPEWRRDAGSD